MDSRNDERPAAAPTASAERAARTRVLRANRALRVLERALWPRPCPKPRRIGILRQGMLGDVAVALPALAALRRAHPRAELFLLTSPGPRGAVGARDLLGPDSDVSLLEWHVEDLATLRGRLEVMRRVRALDLDLVVALPAALTTPRREAAHATFLRLAGVGTARGFAVTNARWLSDPALRRADDAANERAAPWDARGDRPQARRLLLHLDASLRDAGARGVDTIEPPDASSILALGAQERGAARGELERSGLGHAPLLVVAPGAKLATKRWPAERFAAVAADWIERGGEVALVGSPAERPLADEIRAAIAPAKRSMVADFCGRTSVRESAALIASAAVCLSNDSGPAHVAAALGTPLVVVQSARDRRGAWDPCGPGPIRVLRAAVPCAPCFSDACPEGLRCLTAFEPAAVSAALVAVARPRGRRRPGTGTAARAAVTAP